MPYEGLIVLVDTVEPAPGQSVWSGEGTIQWEDGVEIENGDRVRFAGDWRPMRGLAEAVEEHGEVAVELEGWQILSRTPKEA